MKKGVKIVRVEWEDPTTHAGWTAWRKAKKQKPVSIVSYGILITKDNKNIRLGLSYSTEDGEISDVLVIPTSVVKSFEMIRTEKSRRIL